LARLRPFASPPQTRRLRAPSMAFGYEGYPNSDRRDSGQHGVFPRWALAGSWRLEWTDEDGELESFLVNLNDDGSTTPPEINEKEGRDGASRFNGWWNFKGDKLVVKIVSEVGRSLRGLSVTSFEGILKDAEETPYGSVVCGTVLEGEADPEYCGKFNLTQVVGAAKMGLAPGKPVPVQSRASRDFSVTSRSDIKVLERFAGLWDGSLKMEDLRGEVKVELFSNGTFTTREYQRFTTDGLKGDGVLRGRWNVYYSDISDTDRFWMQILRLKCSNVFIHQDLLLIGDLKPVHTFEDISGQLQKQINILSDGGDAKAVNKTNVSLTPHGDVIAGIEEVDQLQKDDKQIVDELEDRGVFTGETERGRSDSPGEGSSRRYDIGGHIIEGHQFEPSIIGDFQLRSRGSEMSP